MIGYILLISMAVAISIFVYGWLKTYVPNDLAECPDGTSISIKEVNCLGMGENYTLNLTLKNNGRFNIAGYFIHATNESDQELATLDLSSKFIRGGTVLGSSILFEEGDTNAMIPNQEKEIIFEFNSQIYSLEILPIRFQDMENKKRLISCGDAKVREVISCS